MSAKRELDRLYREHPSGFVAGRDRLAKEARSAADASRAAELKRLKRPTSAAWLLNAAALRDPGALRAFAKASRDLEAAQRRALQDGAGAARAFRAAAADEREAAETVLESAERLAQEAGHPATPNALKLADETLRAAAADPDLRATVVSGRLDRERSAATIGGLGGIAPPKRGGDAGAKRSAKESAKARDAAQARRELKRLERELAAAEKREAKQDARVEAAAASLGREKASLAERRREAAALRRRVSATRRRIGG